MDEKERKTEKNTKNWTKWKILELYATYNNFGLRKQHGKLMEWYFTLKSFYAYEHLVCAWMALKRTWKKCGAKEKCEPFRRRKEGERKSNESVYSFRHIDCKCDNMWVFFCRPWALLINLCVSKHLSSPLPPSSGWHSAGGHQVIAGAILAGIYIIRYIEICLTFSVSHSVLAFPLFDRTLQYSAQFAWALFVIRSSRTLHKHINWECKHFSVVIQTELGWRWEKQIKTKKRKEKSWKNSQKHTNNIHSE